MFKSENKSFISILQETIADFVKHPKKLFPTVILALVWIAFSIISAVGVNIPILRFLYTLTYANGGMFGGFFGAIGGIFGKAVFAAVVNGLVLSACAKKNPFKGLKNNLPGVFGGGAKAIGPFVLGGGIGILLYFFFNITSSVQNCAIAVAAALMGIKALASRNGLLFSGVFFLLNKISKNKTPSQITVSRMLAGLTAGFAVSFPITFIRLPILVAVLGILLTATGILIPVIGKKRVAAAMLVALIFTSGITTFAFASSDDSFTLVIDPFYKEHKETYGYHYNDWDSWMYYSFYQAGEIKVEKGSDGQYTFTLPGYDYSFTEADVNYSVTIPDVVFSGDRITKDPDNETGYHAVFSAELGDGISTTLTEVHNGKTSMFIHDMKSFELKLSFNTKSEQNGGLKVHSSDSKCVRRSYPEGTEDPDSYTYWSDNASHFSQGFTLYGFHGASASSSEEGEENHDTEYVPYRGRLTYTNGRVNKYGQPFPDLMDFDGDGEITWLDSNIQKELSHDPDWLDRPESKAVGIVLAILTGLLGAAAGAVGGAIGGTAASAAAEAASGIAETGSLSENVGSSNSEKEDLGPYIQRDADGDLNVKDPATGEMRLYKANSDGTYTNPLTGATYSESELKDSLNSRADNADVIRQDDATRKAAIDTQREDAKELSDFTKQLEKEKAEQNAKDERELAHEVYVEKQKIHYNVETEAEVKNKINEEQTKAEIEAYEQLELEKEYYKSQKYAENVKKVSDTAIDVYAELDPTGGGKKLKDAYTVGTAAASNIGDAMAGYKSVGGAFAQTFVDSGVGLAKNHADDVNLTGTGGYAEKAVANITGDGIAATSNELMKGKSLEEAKQAGSDAAIQGGVNFLVDSAFDVVGGKFGSESNDAAGKILGETVTKKSVTGGSKALGADLVKNTLSPDDNDELAHEKFIADREKAEETANKAAAERFRQSQKEWAERDKE